MVSVYLPLKSWRCPMIVASSVASGFVLGLLEGLSFWRLIPPAWAEERALFALVRVSLVHHEGHVFFWRRHPKGHAIVLRVLRSSA